MYSLRLGRGFYPYPTRFVPRIRSHPRQAIGTPDACLCHHSCPCLRSRGRWSSLNLTGRPGPSGQDGSPIFTRKTSAQAYKPDQMRCMDAPRTQRKIWVGLPALRSIDGINANGLSLDAVAFDRASDFNPSISDAVSEPEDDRRNPLGPSRHRSVRSSSTPGESKPTGNTA